MVEFQGTISEKCKRYGFETNVDEPDFDPLFSEPFSLCEYPFFGYITLNYEGFVAPCCRLTNVVHMGDLKEMSFEEVWNGKSFRELRDLMISGDYPSYCHDRCKYRVKMNAIPSDQSPGKFTRQHIARKKKELESEGEAFMKINPVS